MSEQRRLLLTVGEVGTALGLSRGAVYALLLEGHLPSIKIGRSRRVLAADLERWVTARAAEQSDPEHTR
jgi:excisionase family DNA binding protein